MRGVLRLRAAQGEDLALAYPARRRGWVALWGVRAGGIVVEREVGRGAFGEEAAAAVLAELAAAEPPRPPLPAAAIDEMLLVHSWAEAHRAAPGVVDLRAFVAGDEDASVAAARLLRAVRLAASGEPAADGAAGAGAAATTSAAPSAGVQPAAGAAAR